MRSKRRRLTRRLVKKLPVRRSIQRSTSTVAITIGALLFTLVVGSIIKDSGQAQNANANSCAYMPSRLHPASNTDALTARQIGKDMVANCFGESQWAAAEELWTLEADWRPLAINPKSGACGIVQAAPCSKLLNSVGKASLDTTTVEEQMHWGINYVKDRYGTPQNALEFWKSRKPINGKDVGNWY